MAATTTITKKPASSSDDPGIIAQAGFPDNQPSLVWAVDPIGLPKAPLPLPGGQPVASFNNNAFPMNVPIPMAPASAGSVASVNIGAPQGSVDSSNSSSTASSIQSAQHPTQRPVINRVNNLLPVMPG